MCIAAVVRGKCDVFIRSVYRTILEWKCSKLCSISICCREELCSYFEKITNEYGFSQKCHENVIHMSCRTERGMENLNINGQQLATPAPPPREHTTHAHSQTRYHTLAHVHTETFTVLDLAFSIYCYVATTKTTTTSVLSAARKKGRTKTHMCMHQTGARAGWICNT